MIFFTKHFALKSFLIIIFIFCFHSNAQSRFDIAQAPNGNIAAITTVQKSEGLGNILRELGVEPNWQNRSWISAIHAANPELISSSGHVLHSDRQLFIPVEALQDCKGYAELQTSLTSQVNSAKSQEPSVQEPITQESLPPIQEPQEESPTETLEVMAEEVTQPTQQSTAYSLALSVGLGMSALNTSDSANNFADYTSDILSTVEAQLFIHWNSKLDTVFYGRGSFLTYPLLENTVTTHEKEFYLNGGMELNYSLGETWSLGLLTDFRESPRVDFGTTTDMKAVPLISFGLTSSFRFFAFEEKGIFLNLKPQFISSTDKDNLSLDSGFGLKTEILYRPLTRATQTGWMIGFEHLFEQQSATHSAANTSEQNYHHFLLSLGYLF